MSDRSDEGEEATRSARPCASSREVSSRVARRSRSPGVRVLRFGGLGARGVAFAVRSREGCHSSPRALLAELTTLGCVVPLDKHHHRGNHSTHYFEPVCNPTDQQSASHA